MHIDGNASALEGEGSAPHVGNTFPDERPPEKRERPLKEAQFGFQGVDETRWSQEDSTLIGHLLSAT
jgi:hypothetical protein